MPLRAPSELSNSLHIYIFLSSFDDGLDEDDNVLPPLLPFTLLLTLRMFSAVEFLISIFFFYYFY